MLVPPWVESVTKIPIPAAAATQMELNPTPYIGFLGDIYSGLMDASRPLYFPGVSSSTGDWLSATTSILIHIPDRPCPGTPQ